MAVAHLSSLPLPGFTSAVPSIKGIKIPKSKHLKKTTKHKESRGSAWSTMTLALYDINYTESSTHDSICTVFLILVYLCCHVHQIRQLQPSSFSILQEVQKASCSRQKHISSCNHTDTKGKASVHYKTKTFLI